MSFGSPKFPRLLELLRRSPRATLLAAMAAMLALSLPSLGIGFLLDDYVHRYAALGFPGPMGGLRLFDFASGDPELTRPWIEHGPFPWWTDPELRLSFFRPLSSALVLFDSWAFGSRAWLHHLHSVSWGLALVLAAALVYRRLFTGAVFGVAVLLFAVDEAHWMPVAWLANRNALVAATLAFLGLAAHLAWRRDGWRPGAPLSALGFALGLTGGEAALGVFAYLLAFELIVRRDDPFATRLRALVPAALVLVPYLLFYKLLGFGARGSGVYLDPLGDFTQFITAAPGRFLALTGCLGLNFPIDLWLAFPAARAPLVLLGVVTVGFFGWLLRSVRGSLPGPERRLHDALLAGTLLSLVPSLATFPSSRLLVVPSLGVSLLLALALRHLWRAQRRVLIALLLFVHVPICAFHWWGNVSYLARIGRASEAAAARTEIEAEVPGLRVVALTTGDAPTFIYLPLMRALGGFPRPRDWWILSHANLAHRLTRTGVDSLELETVGGRFVDDVYEQVVRTPRRPFRVGEEVRLDGGLVRVVAVQDGLATRIRLQLDFPLDAPDLRFIAWRDGAMRRVSLPAVGETIELPFSPGVMSQTMGSGGQPKALPATAAPRPGR
ncbi:MAG: hypothetical protein ACYC8T_03965 [Myxococcaceae bacterium]